MSTVNNNEKIDFTIEEEKSSTYIEKSILNLEKSSPIVRIGRLIVSLLAIGLAFYTLYTAAFGGLPSWQHRSVFTSVALILCFSYVPYKKGNERMSFLLDGTPLMLSITVLIFAFISYPDISFREGNAGLIDEIMGTLMIFLVIEGVRRTIGIAMAALALFFWLYIFIGPWFPGLLAHQGVSYGRMIDMMFISSNGIFSAPIYVASTVLILFLLFASLLLKTGVGEFFIKASFALTGRLRGGPALAAVFSSGLMATITGNGAANAMMTGSFTIPLMKKVGYRKSFAGAVEAVASQGGQIMPPIMGAAAFIMAEYTGIPFIQIAGYALLPAVLFFVVAGVTVYLQASKQGLEGIPRKQLPSFWKLMFKQGYMILPLFIIIFMMVIGYSPMMAGLWAIIAVFGLSLFKRETRLSILGLLSTLENGVKSSISTVMACAGAGIIAGAVIMTGLGNRFSRLALELADGHLLPMLLLIMVASIILGMGMPTVSAYVILATIVVGGLTDAGVNVLAAHLFVFYFGIFSGITPPVALTSYITAGIAGGDPLKTAIKSMQIGIAAFILPYMMVYNPAILLQGNTITIILGVITALLGLITFSSFLQGWLISETTLWQRGLLLISSICLVIQGFVPGIIGIGILLLVLLMQLKKKQKYPVSDSESINTAKESF